MSLKDYTAIIAGSLSVIIALIMILITFKMRDRRKILPLRLGSLILIILGILTLIELLD